MDDGEDDDFEVKYKDGKLLSTNEPEQSSDEEEDDSEGTICVCTDDVLLNFFQLVSVTV